MNRQKQLQQTIEQQMARGGSEHKEEIREKTIRVRRKTYDRLRARGKMGHDFDDVITGALDKLEEYEHKHEKAMKK